MQIRVGTTVRVPTPQVTLANLKTVFAKTAGKRGVFEVSQDPIIMPQAAYASAYNSATFPTNALGQYVQIAENSKTFKPINAAGILQPPVTIPLQPKAMHDEMGGVYDDYGRMSGMLGLSTSVTSTAANFVAYGYASPPVDFFKEPISGAQIGSLDDGTQIWRIVHNGVDTHTIHTHLFTSQVINRVSMDGGMLPPDANELGWKDTIRVNPLEHTIIAMKPMIPVAPFAVPNSIRLIDPTMPSGVPLTEPPPAGWFTPGGVSIPQVLNHMVNYGQEHVWHCHILAHEEMDMMHSLSLAISPAKPFITSATRIGGGNNRSIVLNWKDSTVPSLPGAGFVNTTSFEVQRATNVSFTNNLMTIPLGGLLLPPVLTYTDPIGSPNQVLYYRVNSVNTVGDVATAGFPTTVLRSVSNTVAYPSSAPLVAPAAPSPLTAVNLVQNNRRRVTLNWTNVANESGYTVQYTTDSTYTSGLVTTVLGANVNTMTTGNLLKNTTYYFRVQAFNSADPSAWVTTSITTAP
ncbi:MAG TPA: hypothetical protein DCY86_10205 [Bdellovibrionales bacterium]|nr:hypothetical protein [Bdellovibrionales bacterium]